jgi:glycosyltransferase involved in cell wall biosynthesis
MAKDVDTIVVDGLSALQGGGQTYLINLFRFLPPRLLDTMRVIAVIPTDDDVFRVNDRIEYVHSSFASGGLMRRMIWTRFRLPALLRQTQARVLFCPAGFVSTFAGEWKTAVVFRNMLPFNDEERGRYPFGYLRARLFLLRYIQSRSFRKADLVIFISQFAKSVIDIVVRSRAGRSVVIPHGINDHFRNATAERPASAAALPEKYVAYVSILTVYKAQIEVVQAWALLRRRRPTEEKLVLVGPLNQPYVAQVRATIARLGLQDEVILAGDLPYEMLPSVYHGAVANIFASSCENCPNILLEALAAGKPVLCSDYQPMPEFGSTAVRYFNPYEPESLASSLNTVLEDSDLRLELGRRARARSIDFQWKKSAEDTWQALSDLAAEGRSA